MTVFVLAKSGPSHWLSLNEIYPSLRKALELTGLSLQWVSDECTPLHCEPTDVIYVLSADFSLDVVLQSLPLDIRIFLPVYGDMTIEFEKWRKWDLLLRGRNITLLVASPRSGRQIGALVKAPIVAVLPYPVAENFFTVNPKRTEEFSLVYAGRITPQKNVLELMKMFIATNTWGTTGTLHIAGAFHDRGFHFHSRGYDAVGFVKTFHELVAASGESIVYHGHLPQAELADLFSRSSYVASISTYHDEDYGLSVAQGMATGCAPILSDWGGHGYFLESGHSRKVEISLDDFATPNPKLKSISKALLEASRGEVRAELIRTWAEENFSVASTGRRLKVIFETRGGVYQGQSDVFRQFCDSYDTGRGVPFHHKSPGFKDLYEKIYSSYLGVL